MLGETENADRIRKGWKSKIMAKGFDDAVKVIMASPFYVLIGHKYAINYVLARVWSLYGLEPFRVVEEPENGVHPSELGKVVTKLRDGKKRVIIITYSPYLLDFFMPQEVSLCVMDGQGEVSLHRLSESDVVKEQSKVFTLGEIWTAEGDIALMGFSLKEG